MSLDLNIIKEFYPWANLVEYNTVHNTAKNNWAMVSQKWLDESIPFLAYILELIPICLRNKELHYYVEQDTSYREIGVVIRGMHLGCLNEDEDEDEDGLSFMVEYRYTVFNDGRESNFRYWHRIKSDFTSGVTKLTSPNPVSEFNLKDGKCIVCKRKCYEESTIDCPSNGGLPLNGLAPTT